MDRNIGSDAGTRELPLIAELKKPAEVPAAVIAGFGDDEELAIKQAILWAWRERRIKAMSQRRAAESCGMTSSHFSNMLWGDKYLPPQKINQFEWLCGSTAVSQTIARFAELRRERMVTELARIVAEQMSA